MIGNLRSIRAMLVFCLTAWAALAAANVRADALRFYVATDGSDSWTGTLAEPNGDKTDGPFATLAGARDAVRKLRGASEQALASVTVVVRGGVYRLDAPFLLEPQDSGTPQGPVVFTAAPGEQPVLSGGRVISGFQQRGSLWETVIPEVKDGKWYFRQLFVNGERRQRARSPNEGYFRIAEQSAGTARCARESDRPRPLCVSCRRPCRLGPAERRESDPHALVGDLDPSAAVRRRQPADRAIHGSAEGMVVHRLLGEGPTLLRRERCSSCSISRASGT